MWNTPHSKTGWNLGTEDESTEYFYTKWCNLLL